MNELIIFKNPNQGYTLNPVNGEIYELKNHTVLLKLQKEVISVNINKKPHSRRAFLIIEVEYLLNRLG
jgi:hypothetical protein